MENFNDINTIQKLFRKPTLEEQKKIANSELHKRYTWIFALLFGFGGSGLSAVLFYPNYFGMSISVLIFILLASLIPKNRKKVKQAVENVDYKVISGKCVKKYSIGKTVEQIYKLEILTENEIIGTINATPHEYKAISENDNVLIIDFKNLTLICRND